MKILSTLDKALRINIDDEIYGTFAEIGAGQEVARQFFEAGRASNTIAKTISAYDMIFSDSIYGPEENNRYVCQNRVETMLDYEYNLVKERLQQERGKRSKFFAYANTLTTGSRSRNIDSHGWIGLKFQTTVNGPVNQVVAHIRMKDSMLRLQRKAVGVLGVNLVYACFHHLNHTDKFLSSLMDSLDPSRLEIDFIEFSGKDTEHIDNRLMSLNLVKNNYTPAAIFSPDGTVLHIADVLFKKDVLLLRGNFQPITNVHMDMVGSALDHLNKSKVKPCVIFELTLKDLQKSSDKLEASFLDRIDALRALGYPVLISNFFLFNELKQYLEKFTDKKIAMVIGANLMEKIIDEKYYKNLEGGLLEGMGKLLNGNVSLLVYPYTSNRSQTTLDSILKQKNHDVLNYLVQHFQIHDINCHNDVCRNILSENVLKMLQEGNKEWKDYVPKPVADVIEQKKLFRLK